jgi:hypothetical protein
MGQWCELFSTILVKFIDAHSRTPDYYDDVLTSKIKGLVCVYFAITFITSYEPVKTGLAPSSVPNWRRPRLVLVIVMRLLSKLSTLATPSQPL